MECWSVFGNIIHVQSLHNENLVLDLSSMFFTPLTKVALSPNLWREPAHVDSVARWVETKQQGLCVYVWQCLCAIYLFMWWWEKKIKQETNWKKKRKTEMCIDFRTADQVCGVVFNKHNPDGTSEAARWAVAPVWFQWQSGHCCPDSLPSSHRWCPPAAQRSASR